MLVNYDQAIVVSRTVKRYILDIMKAFTHLCTLLLIAWQTFEIIPGGLGLMSMPHDSVS